MNILALETSTEACSAALLTTGGDLHSEFELAPRRHTELLPAMQDAVIATAGIDLADLDAIAFSNGPGAFTGVRIAAACAQGIAIGLTIPIVPVSTLAVLAQHACDRHSAARVMAALDARMGEVYCGEYRRSPDSGLVECVGEEQLVNAARLVLHEDALGAGSGFRARREAGGTDEKGALIVGDAYPTAEALARLAARALRREGGATPDQASINYLRNRVAWQQTAR